MGTKSKLQPTLSKVSGKSPSDQRQADRTAANKAKRRQNTFTSIYDDKPDYTRRSQRTVQYQRDPCDVVEMFYIATRARLH